MCYIGECGSYIKISALKNTEYFTYIYYLCITTIILSRCIRGIVLIALYIKKNHFYEFKLRIIMIVSIIFIIKNKLFSNHSS